jgi:CubicO group peptidase (beta-lactamase class C family)
MMEIHAPEKVGFSVERLKRVSSGMKKYVDEGLVAGIITLVARKGVVVHLEKSGYQNLQEKKPMALDTLFRIYSMTKPIASAALMMLYEQGLVRLEDPIHKYMPWFKDLKVIAAEGDLVKARQDITVRHLLTHTAGLSYGEYQIEQDSQVDRLYVDSDLENPTITNEELARRIADLPLRYHPGENWFYSYATDIVGYLVEILSEMTLSEFMGKNIFGPLGMEDTFFRVPNDKTHRLSELYGVTEDKPLDVIDASIGGDFFNCRRDGAGSGLVSTIEDFYRFAQCIFNRGELDGFRILGSRTVDLMRANHLPASLLPIPYPGGIPWGGEGFGLGFSVVMDSAQANLRGAVGSYGWGGWASTHVWIDPVEEIIRIIMAQHIPGGYYPIREDFGNAVYQALID